MTKLHLIYIMYERARQKLESKKIRDANLVTNFKTVLANFALKSLQADNINLYESGFFGAGSNDLLDAAYKQTLVDLRPQMIGLCELVPEGYFPSSIGNEYGDIYETQFSLAQESRLNTGEVPEFYHTHMKPVMKMCPPPKL